MKKFNNKSDFRSPLYYGFWLVVIIVSSVLVEKTGLNTLLPICIPWMYYQFSLLLFYIVLDPVFRKMKAKYCIKKGIIRDHIYSSEIVLLLIIIPSLLLLPNRYIKKGTDVEYRGIVVDSTKWALTRTASWDNYVKIRLDDKKKSFWYKTRKESKPLGSKCIVTTRKGIFGVSYVEDVSFLVE